MIERKDANREFYGSPVTARDILNGLVPPPEIASKLYEIIEAAEGLDDVRLPDSSHIPHQSEDMRSGGLTVFDAETQ